MNYNIKFLTSIKFQNLCKHNQIFIFNQHCRSFGHKRERIKHPRFKVGPHSTTCTKNPLSTSTLVGSTKLKTKDLELSFITIGYQDREAILPCPLLVNFAFCEFAL